tara:strand:+ start:1328 stop:1732 length:405 start_codon:yes stop_codon:yes gene_type:complete
MSNLIFAIIFIVAFGFRNGYQFKENRAKGEEALKFNRYWHAWQALIQGDFAVCLWFNSDFNVSIGILFASAFWLFFDGIVNKFLGKRFFYLGKTAAIDRFLRYIFMSKWRLFSAIMKVTFFVSSVIFYLYQNYG